MNKTTDGIVEIAMRLSKTDIVWLAGLLDGEGCFFFSVRGDMDVVKRVSHRTGG